MLSTGVLAAPSPSSVSAANYYEMKPNPWYVSLGVKGYQQTDDSTCGPSAVMSLMNPGQLTNNVYIIAVPRKQK